MKSGMKQTKKLTVSAAVVALGVLFMTLGFFIEALDLTVAALLSLAMVFVFLEIGSPYTWLVYGCTTLLGFVFYSGSLVWLTYGLVFGAYPILKAYIEKLPRGLWLALKLVYFNAVLIALVYLCELILGIPLVAVDSAIVKGAFYILFNVAFVLYDVCINAAVRIYYARLRPRIASLLK